MSALSLLARSESLISQGRFAAAHALLIKSLHFPIDDFLKAEILSLDAEALRALGRFKESLNRYRATLKIFLGLGVVSEAVSARLGASACLRVLGDYDTATKLWADAAPQKSRPMGLAPLRADVELERALVARGQGRFFETRFRLKRALKILEKCGKQERARKLQHAYWILGGVERFSGRFRPAQAAFKKAAALAQSLGDRSAEAYALFGWAGVLRVLGKDRVSFNFYRQAYRMMVAECDPFGQAYGLCGQANALRTFGSAADSIGLYRRSARLYRRLGDQSSEGFAHWGLGGSWRRLKKFSRSWASYQNALRLFVKSQDDRGVVMAHVGLARWWQDQGNVAQAVASIRRALSTAKKAKLTYEVALARYEQGRIQKPTRGPDQRLGRLGISGSVLSRWKDVP